MSVARSFDLPSHRSLSSESAQPSDTPPRAVLVAAVAALTLALLGIAYAYSGIGAGAGDGHPDPTEQWTD